MKKGIIIGISISIVIILTTLWLEIFYIKKYKNYYEDVDFNIETYVSSVDKDNDGIDDQTDMLGNVKEYISKNPKYKSKYYDTRKI